MAKKSSRWTSIFGSVAAIAGLIVSTGLLPKDSLADNIAKAVAAASVYALGKAARDNGVSDEEAAAGVKPKVSE